MFHSVTQMGSSISPAPTRRNRFVPFGNFLVTSQHPSPQELHEQQPWPAPIDHLEPENPNNQKRSVPNQHKRMNRQFLGEYPSTF
jgi:hypothetical protein